MLFTIKLSASKPEIIGFGASQRGAKLTLERLHVTKELPEGVYDAELISWQRGVQDSIKRTDIKVRWPGIAKNAAGTTYKEATLEVA